MQSQVRNQECAIICLLNILSEKTFSLFVQRSLECIQNCSAKPLKKVVVWKGWSKCDLGIENLCCITTSVSKYSITNFLVTKIASRDFHKRVFQLWPFWNVNILTDFMKLFRWSWTKRFLSTLLTFLNFPLLKIRKSLIFYEQSV